MDFKKLHAWERAHALAIDLHRLANHFTGAAYADLRSQLTRAAHSISTNIAEGCGAATKKEFARFLDISLKSANETEHHLLSARDLRLLARGEWQRHTDELIEIRKMVYTYRKRILESMDE